jgi:integrase
MAVLLDPKTKKLIIRFRVKGYAKQFYISSGLRNTKGNKSIVDSRWELIQREIALGEFDPTLDRYRFKPKNPVILTPTISLLELWDKFTTHQENILQQTTIEHIYKLIHNLISTLPTDSPQEIKSYLFSKYSYGMVRLIINKLSQCYEWGINESLVTANPFQTLKLPKQKKRHTNDDIAAYTLEERDLIIDAFEKHKKYYYYAPLIKFLFWTGCRPGEAFALTWGDISEDCTKINISKSWASRIREVKATKNCKKRIFPAAPGGKLQKLLLSIRREGLSPDQPVFTNLRGKRISQPDLDAMWRGYTSNGYKYPGVVKALAAVGRVPYLKAYSTRHTFATWAIALGTSPDKVAYWLGDDTSTVLTYYCHPEISKSDCPDF